MIIHSIYVSTLLIGLMLVAVIGLSQVILGLRDLWNDIKDYIKDRKKNE